MVLNFDCFGPICDDDLKGLRDYLELFDESKVERLRLTIYSSGGSIAAGIAMYNYLMSLPYPVTTHNLSEIDTAALLPYLAGTERTAGVGATFLIGPMMDGHPGYFSEAWAKKLDVNEKALCKIVAETIKDPEKPLNIRKCLTKKAVTLSVDDAIKHGIVTVGDRDA